jgi:hypothetical protein
MQHFTDLCDNWPKPAPTPVTSITYVVQVDLVMLGKNFTPMHYDIAIRKIKGAKLAEIAPLFF